jgi:hypothetical protein
MKGTILMGKKNPLKPMETRNERSEVKKRTVDEMRKAYRSRTGEKMSAASFN